MRTIKFVTGLIIHFCLAASCLAQSSPATDSFAQDLKKLIDRNNLHNILDLSIPEAITLSNASPAQIIEITAPYHHSDQLNAKGVCFYLLSHSLMTKEISQQQKEELVEIICGNYLATGHEIQTNNNVLLMLSEKDFNTKAKEYIAALMDSIPPFNYAICSKLSAIAQVKKNIPAIWNYANKNIYTMQKADIDVLAALSRLGEKEADSLLCSYYSSDWNKRERTGLAMKSYVTYSKQLAFSLSPVVLSCLVADFRNVDLNFRERGNDYSWWPAQYLGVQITDMLINYPYPKEYQLDPFQLLSWLNSSPAFELKEK